MSIAELEAQLAGLADAFIAANAGRRPTQADIGADAAWSAAYTRKRALEREAAVQLPGGCSVYIVRRRRFCTHAAADGLGGLCSEHAAEQAPASAPLPLPPRVEAADDARVLRKRNLKRRMKRMANPRARPPPPNGAADGAALPPALPSWDAVFADPSLPLLLDIGCAKGRFLAELARSTVFSASHGAHNFLGVELFAPLVRAANAARDAASLRNLHYLAGAAETVLPTLPSGCRLQRATVQFPDPWQADQAARRVLSAALLTWLAAALPPGGELFLVSDVPHMARHMRTDALAHGGGALFALHAAHQESGAARAWGEAEPGDAEAHEAPPEGGWLRVRPYGVPTERDKVCEAKWRPVFRTLLVRTDAPAPLQDDAPLQAAPPHEPAPSDA
jgi:tRNA (guanine-N7-)-methyltransferase